MSRQALDLATAEHLEIVAIPAAVDLLDTLQRFGDLDIDDDAEDKLGIIIQALKQAAGRLMLRQESAEASPELRIALMDIRAKAAFEQAMPTGLHMTCLSLIEKSANHALELIREKTS